jgi:DNA-binding NarL/FixJ family response regulator
VAEGLATRLHRPVDLVGTVGDGRQRLEAARALRPDVIVADMAMPVVRGLAARRQLTAERLDANVILLTMHADAQLATEAWRAGASGDVLKHAAGEERMRAMQAVVEGRVSLTPRLTKDVLTPCTEPTPQPAVPLTPRQREGLQRLAAGRRMQEIAATLQLSTRTVKTHNYQLMRRLGVDSTAALVRSALELGLVGRSRGPMVPLARRSGWFRSGAPRIGTDPLPRTCPTVTPPAKAAIFLSRHEAVSQER